jgi:hypothetical protein
MPEIAKGNGEIEGDNTYARIVRGCERLVTD